MDVTEKEKYEQQQTKAFKVMLTDEFAGAALQGLLSSAPHSYGVSYETAHQAYTMATYMLAVRDRYVNQGS